MNFRFLHLGYPAWIVSILCFVLSLPPWGGWLRRSLQESSAFLGSWFGLLFLPLLLLFSLGFAYRAARLARDAPQGRWYRLFFFAIALGYAWLTLASALVFLSSWASKIGGFGLWLLLADSLLLAFVFLFFAPSLRMLLQPIRRMEEILSVSHVHAEQLPDVVRLEAQREAWLRSIRILGLSAFAFGYFAFLAASFFTHP